MMDPQLLRATRDAAVLALISNILGQALKCHQTNVRHLVSSITTIDVLTKTQISYSINTTDLFHFVLFAILSTPPNYIWQTWLEHRFPGYTDRSPVEHDKDSKPDTSHKQLNIPNTLIKFILDQTLAAAINTVLFVGGIAFLRGKPVDLVVNDCREQLWPLMSAGWKVWPAVSLTNFLLVPVDYRTTFGGVFGLFW